MRAKYYLQPPMAIYIPPTAVKTGYSSVFDLNFNTRYGRKNLYGASNFLREYCIIKRHIGYFDVPTKSIVEQHKNLGEAQKSVVCFIKY